jgi:pyruvate kinase
MKISPSAPLFLNAKKLYILVFVKVIMTYHLWFTRGPSTKYADVMKKMFLKGATGVRLTYSYGTPALQSKRALRIKMIAKKVKRPCMVVADLEGEKYRLALSTGMDYKKLIRGQKLRLIYSEKPADYRRSILHVRAKDFFSMVCKGDMIVIGDGSAYIRVLSVDTGVNVIVEKGGVINPNRGLTIQSGRFQPTALTPKDRKDLKSIVKDKNIDAIAVSFVSSAKDIKDVRAIVRKAGRKMKIIAKVETPAGIKNIVSIVKEADMVIAARGDLALTYPWHELPNAMQAIAKAAKRYRKPWIVATQIVEGLELFGFPTRPEICDLAHWAQNGAGALLSSETAFGQYPVSSVDCARIMLDRWYKKV